MMPAHLCIAQASETLDQADVLRTSVTTMKTTTQKKPTLQTAATTLLPRTERSYTPTAAVVAARGVSRATHPARI